MPKSLLTDLLNIPSPTYQEAEKVAFITQWMAKHCPRFECKQEGDSVIFHEPVQSGQSKPHITLVGHSDTVPAFFEAYESEGKLYGSGASDMLGGVAAFMTFLAAHHDRVDLPYQFSFIVYAKEEGTPLEENGLYDLIQAFPQFFTSVDLAIVGEPTDNTIQLGCVGSLHAKVRINGQACHSARPWFGVNALYEALPFIKHIQAFEPRKHQCFGVEFADVMHITESQSEPGRTSLPGYWEANVNYRYAPVWSLDEADAFFYAYLTSSPVKDAEIEITDKVFAGEVIESDLFKQVMATLDKPLQAKQAWTDVAQLTKLGISAFNYGPGLTSQAHRVDEYIVLKDLDDYVNGLNALVR